MDIFKSTLKIGDKAKAESAPESIDGIVDALRNVSNLEKQLNNISPEIEGI